MAYPRKLTVTLGPTAADGTGTFYSDYVGAAGAHVEALKFAIGTLSAGADLTITDEDTGLPIVTWTNPADGAVVYPRAATHDVTGAASLYAAGGAAVNAPIPVTGRVKVVVAQGGNAKSGTLTVVLG